MLSVLLADVVRMSEGSNKALDRIGVEGVRAKELNRMGTIKYRLPQLRQRQLGGGTPIADSPRTMKG